MMLLPAVVSALVVLGYLTERRLLREAALVSVTVAAAVSLILTVVLSQFRLLAFNWVVGCWTAIAIALVVMLRHRIPEGWRTLRQLLRTREWGVWEWLTAVIIGLFALGTLLAALLYPIMNSDSLSYHMPRVFFWFQNRSIGHFPTPEGRHLFASPLAEYLILKLKILSGGTDTLANTIQWLAYVFSILTASLIALRLGAERRGQQAAALATAATPMALLQASSTQNDLVCACWCLAAAYWVVTYMDREPRAGAETTGWVLLLSTSLALAVLTKPSAYLVLAPFAVWLAVVAIRRDGLKRATVLAASVIAVLIVLNAGWYVENARVLDGDVIGLTAPGGNANLLISDRDPSSVITNVIKNTSMMLGTPSDTVNRAIAGAVRGVVAAYGGDIENPRTLDRNMPSSYALDHRVTYHDVGPSPLIVLLILVSALALLFSGRREARVAKWYLLCASSAMLLTAGLIGYSYYMNRILLPPLLLLVPVMGAGVSAATSADRHTAKSLLVALLGLAVAWGVVVMLFNSTNRLVPPSLTPVTIGSRDLGYWNTPYRDLVFEAHLPQLEKPYKDIARIIRRGGYRRVGIDSEALNVSIYPLLALLSDREVKYVGHTVLRHKIRHRRFSPDVVIEIVPEGSLATTPTPGTPARDVLYGPASGLGVTLTLYRTR